MGFNVNHYCSIIMRFLTQNHLYKLLLFFLYLLSLLFFYNLNEDFLPQHGQILDFLQLIINVSSVYSYPISFNSLLNFFIISSNLKYLHNLLILYYNINKYESIYFKSIAEEPFSY